jgi:epoxide hydrolase-like predicted phosphatase
MPHQALLFDLGGVLIDIDFGRALSAWSPFSSLPAAELQRRFRIDEPYERHERGEITAQDYFSHLATTLQLSATAAQVEEGWNSIFVREITQTRELVERVRGQLPCYAFTNTNASHMSHWTRLYPAVATAFDRIFASHEMGLRKPEPATFDHICRSLGLAPEAILFFDDTPENVEAAARAGLHSVLVGSPDDVAAALAATSLP